MECLNKVLKKVKSGLIMTLIFMMCITTVPSFATDPVIEEGPPGSTEGETTETNLPHIDMKVKVGSKVGGANQVLVECWASKINNLAEIDIAFTYDNTILEPSYINGDNKNEILDGLLNVEEEVDGEKVITERGIKYENRPEVLNPSTGLNIDEQTAFNNKSKQVLSNSFEFKSGYENYLDIFVFQYLAPNGNNEALKFVIRNETINDIPNITDEVLIGTFSFRKISDASLEGTFATKYIGITSDNNDEGWDIRDITGGPNNDIEKNCEDLVEFVYEKFGSISGTIVTKDIDSCNIATIKIYKKNEVESIKWDSVESEYDEQRSKLKELEKIEYTTTVDDNGKFLIEVPFDKYVVLIDKYMYVDYIITDIDVSNAETINLDEKIGNIELIVGDYDKNGVIDAYDRSNFIDAYNKKPKDDTFDIDDTGELDAYDRERFIVSYNMYRNKTDVKKVETLGNN